MSLNKLTDTQKGYDLGLRIGAAEMKCDTLEVDGEELKYGLANRAIRFDGTPFSLTTVAPLPSRYPVSLTSNRGGQDDRDVFEKYTDFLVNGITCKKRGLYTISGMVNFTVNVPCDRVELSVVSLAGTTPSITGKGGANSVSGFGGIINFSTNQLLTGETSLVLHIGTSTANSVIQVKEYDFCIKYLSDIGA